MNGSRERAPGLDLFWEEADHDAADEHPLARELEHRLDALARYDRLISEADNAGWDDAITHLTEEYRRELRVVETLTRALRDSGELPPPRRDGSSR